MTIPLIREAGRQHPDSDSESSSYVFMHNVVYTGTEHSRRAFECIDLRGSRDYSQDPQSHPDSTPSRSDSESEDSRSFTLQYYRGGHSSPPGPAADVEETGQHYEWDSDDDSPDDIDSFTQAELFPRFPPYMHEWMRSSTDINNSILPEPTTNSSAASSESEEIESAAIKSCDTNVIYDSQVIYSSDSGSSPSSSDSSESDSLVPKLMIKIPLLPGPLKPGQRRRYSASQVVYILRERKRAAELPKLTKKHYSGDSDDDEFSQAESFAHKKRPIEHRSDTTDLNVGEGEHDADVSAPESESDAEPEKGSGYDSDEEHWRKCVNDPEMIMSLSS